MKRLATGSVVVLAMVCATMTVGCSKAPDAEKPPATEPDGGAPEGEPAAATEGSSEIDQALAALSAVDKELVMAQKVCPVSGEALGSMGAPIKVTQDGRDLFVCCDGCTDKAEENFAEYVAKLDAEKDDAVAN